jgi:hypothetical protein
MKVFFTWRLKGYQIIDFEPQDLKSCPILSESYASMFYIIQMYMIFKYTKNPL